MVIVAERDPTMAAAATVLAASMKAVASGILEDAG